MTHWNSHSHGTSCSGFEDSVAIASNGQQREPKAKRGKMQLPVWLLLLVVLSGLD